MVNIGQTSPGLVIPQISSAPTSIGTPQYVQSAQDGRGKQGQSFSPPQGPIGMPMYNGQSYPYFGVMLGNQGGGTPQPPNQPPTSYPGNVPQAAPQQQQLASQLQSHLPQFNQGGGPGMPPPTNVAQPMPPPMTNPYGGHHGFVGDTGYTRGGWDLGNGRMPGRTYAR